MGTVNSTQKSGSAANGYHKFWMQLYLLHNSPSAQKNTNRKNYRDMFAKDEWEHQTRPVKILKATM